MTVIIDLIAGSSVNQSEKGYTAVRAAIVYDIVGNKDAKIFNALQDPDLPKRGDLHPSIPNLILDVISARSIDTDKVLVNLNYRQLQGEDRPPNEASPAQISVGATVQLRTTESDKDGNQIILEHTFTDFAEDGTASLRTEKQGVELQVPVVQPTIRLVRREPRDPLQKALKFLGTVNKTSFAGGDKGQWLCTRLEGDSDDGGVSYMVTYEFQFLQKGWTGPVRFIDPVTRKPPEDLVQDVGILEVETFEEEDFSDLNLGELA